MKKSLCVFCCSLAKNTKRNKDVLSYIIERFLKPCTVDLESGQQTFLITDNHGVDIVIGSWP